MRYSKSDMKAGAYLELDCDIRTRVPRPPRYGDPAPDPAAPPDFSAISHRLDDARARLNKFRADLRAARERK